MKNSYLSIRDLYNRIAGLLIFILFIVLFGSCEKDETLVSPENKVVSTVVTADTPTHDMYKNNDEPVIPQEFLSIDHHSLGLGDGRDYKVVLFDDGSVLFQGRAKVAYLGDHVSHISHENVEYIRNMFMAANFFYLPSADPGFAIPLVETTFTDGIHTATVRDLNNGIPQLLLQIRTKAEEKMNIGELISRSPVGANPVAHF